MTYKKAIQKDFSDRKKHKKRGSSAKPAKNRDYFMNYLGGVGNQNIQKAFKAGRVMAKLKISQPGDPHEREADRIAAQVVSSSASKPSRVYNAVSRNYSGGQSRNGITASKIRSMSNGGTTFSKNVRSFYEKRMGADFSNVQIHRGPKAEKMATSINARAFTHGSNVYFNKGEYQPQSTSGKRLIAHELTHVVQQQGGHSIW